MATKKRLSRAEDEAKRRTDERRQRREARRQRIALSPINPHVFYRMAEWGEAFFGFAASQLETKIRMGEIPKPISLTDTGRARGWFGHPILAWQQERLAKAAQSAA
jgi:predicted DNA-binding transcriptional regulator AlpA